MTHLRNCPLMVGYVSVLMDRAKWPENEDLEDGINELLGLVAASHTSEESTTLRGFRVVEEMSRTLLPRHNRPPMGVTGVTSRAWTTLGALERNEKANQVFREGMDYTEEGVRLILEAVDKQLEIRELDSVSMSMNMSVDQRLAEMSINQLVPLENSVASLRKVSGTLLKALRGGKVSWSRAGTEACAALCDTLLLDKVLSLGRALQATSMENARPEWTQ